MTRLQQLRIDAGLSPEQLGALAKVAGMTIRRIEQGKPAHAGTLAKLAKVLPSANASDLVREALPVEERKTEKAA